jgi:hypothetical protein
MRLMGHSTITVSQRYVHPSPESVENAAARMEAMSERKLLEVGIPMGIPNATATPEVEQVVQIQYARVAKSADAKDLK